MKVFTLPSQELVQFDSSEKEFRNRADTKEKVSNFFLLPARITFGYIRVIGNQIEKIERKSLAIFAFILTLPLSLSLTLVGILLNRYSVSHWRNYSSLKKQVVIKDPRCGFSIIKKLLYESSLILNQARYTLSQLPLPKGRSLMF